MQDKVLAINATEFKAKCLGLAELTLADRKVPDLFGCMEGSVIIPPDVDPAEPVLEDIPDAELGILRR